MIGTLSITAAAILVCILQWWMLGRFLTWQNALGVWRYGRIINKVLMIGGVIGVLVSIAVGASGGFVLMDYCLAVITLVVVVVATTFTAKVAFATILHYSLARAVRSHQLVEVREREISRAVHEASTLHRVLSHLDVPAARAWYRTILSESK